MSLLDPSLWANQIGPALNNYPSALAQLQKKATMGIGEASQERPMVADIRVEKIENGYLVVYRKTGVSEKRKYARNMEDVGEVTKQACIELELT